MQCGFWHLHKFGETMKQRNQRRFKRLLSPLWRGHGRSWPGKESKIPKMLSPCTPYFQLAIYFQITIFQSYLLAFSWFVQLLEDKPAARSGLVCWIPIHTVRLQTLLRGKLNEVTQPLTKWNIEIMFGFWTSESIQKSFAIEIKNFFYKIRAQTPYSFLIGRLIEHHWIRHKSLTLEPKKFICRANDHGSVVHCWCKGYQAL